MADQFKVAPLSPSAGAVTDSSEAAQYQEALNQSMKALEQRMQPQTNLFNVAAGFLKPTRSGSFGESLGNVNEAMGREQERQQQETVPIAQMRAQLAGQKYEMAQRGKAMESLNGMLGVSPTITKDDLPAIAKSTGLAIDDPQLTQFIGQPKAAFMNGSGQSVVGVTAQPAINKDELNQALIASGGNPTAAIKMIFERQTKWGEPSQLQKDLKFATDPSTPPAVREIVMAKVSSEADRLGMDKDRFFAETGVRLPERGKPQASVQPSMQPSAATAKPVAAEDIMPIPDLAKQLQRDFGLKPEQLSLERTAAQQADLIKRHAAGEPGIYTPAPLTEGKDIYHQGAIDVPTSVPASYMVARGYTRPDPKGDPVHWVPNVAKPVNTTTATQPAASETIPAVVPGTTTPASEFSYPDGTPVIIPASVPPAKRYEFVEKRLGEYQQNVEKAETNTGKVYEKKLEGIAVIDPAVLKKQNTDFVEAKQIVNNPQLKPYMGQLFKQGFVPGMMTALENGISVGPWRASLPAYAVWLNSLPVEVQTEFKRLDQILGGAYMTAVSAKPFGAAPSNFEDLQMKNTMATSKDPYKIINNFLNEQTITNTHLADMRGRFDKFNTTKAKNVQPYGFFGTPGYQ